MTICERRAVPKEMDCSSMIPSYLIAATVTFSAGEEIGIYTPIFAIYSGVSSDTPFSLWIRQICNFYTCKMATIMSIPPRSLSLVQFRS